MRNCATPFVTSPFSKPAVMYGQPNGADANQPMMNAMRPVTSLIARRRSV
jgi:hypothetical protein